MEELERKGKTEVGSEHWQAQADSDCVSISRDVLSFTSCLLPVTSSFLSVPLAYKAFSSFVLYISIIKLKARESHYTYANIRGNMSYTLKIWNWALKFK